MSYQPQSFQTFANLKGIHLLRDDIAFIKKCLACIPYNLRKSVLEHYAQEWLKGMGMTDIVYQKQNMGRRMANTYMREKSNG